MALSCTRAELAVLACRRGELREAENLVAAARNAAMDDLETQIRWRLAGALVEDRPGRSELALELAEEAVGLASETDGLDLHAEALETFVGVGGSRRALAEAFELATLRGNVVAAARIKAA